MKPRVAVCLIALALMISLIGSPVTSQDTSPDKGPYAQKMGPYAPDMPSSDEIMQKMMAAGQPTKFHKRFDCFIGEWDIETKVWMAGPSNPPAVSKGTSTTRWKLAGKWLESHENTDFMGMPHESFSLFGYDNFKKKYTCSTINSMDTQMISVSGSINPAGDTMIMYGTLDEASTGEVSKNIKVVIHIPSDDKRVMEIHDLAIPEPHTKVMEYHYSRKPKSN